MLMLLLWELVWSYSEPLVKSNRPLSSKNWSTLVNVLATLTKLSKLKECSVEQLNCQSQADIFTTNVMTWSWLRSLNTLWAPSLGVKRDYYCNAPKTPPRESSQQQSIKQPPKEHHQNNQHQTRNQKHANRTTNQTSQPMTQSSQQVAVIFTIQLGQALVVIDSTCNLVCTLTSAGLDSLLGRALVYHSRNS